MDTNIANTPAPPYYAVIFTSLKSDAIEGYEEMAARMEALAKQQPGYLGMESARNDVGITVSYWSSLEAIEAWRTHAAHVTAQQRGKEAWYEYYSVRVCKVERAYSFRTGMRHGDF